jgi:hypothetical protein
VQLKFLLRALVCVQIVALVGFEAVVVDVGKLLVFVAVDFFLEISQDFSLESLEVFLDLILVF